MACLFYLPLGLRLKRVLGIARGKNNIDVNLACRFSFLFAHESRIVDRKYPIFVFSHSKFKIPSTRHNPEQLHPSVIVTPSDFALRCMRRLEMTNKIPNRCEIPQLDSLPSRVFFFSCHKIQSDTLFLSGAQYLLGSGQSVHTSPAETWFCTIRGKNKLDWIHSGWQSAYLLCLTRQHTHTHSLAPHIQRGGYTME